MKAMFEHVFFFVDKTRPVYCRPSTDEAPPIGKNHPFSKIALTFEPVMRLSKILVTIKTLGVGKILAPSYFLLPLFLPIPLEVFLSTAFEPLLPSRGAEIFRSWKQLFFFQFWHKTANFNLSVTECIVFVIISTETLKKKLSNAGGGGGGGWPMRGWDLVIWYEGQWEA